MVTNFKANSKVNWLPFITLPFPVVFGHSQSFDVSCIYLLCHIFSLWIVFFFLFNPLFLFDSVIFNGIICYWWNFSWAFKFFFTTHHDFRFSGSLLTLLSCSFPLTVFCFQSWFLLPWGILSLSLIHTHGVCSAVRGHSVVSDSWWSHGLWLPGSSVHGASPGKNTGVVAMPSPRGSSWSRGNWTRVSCIASGFFTIWTTREAHTWRSH